MSKIDELYKQIEAHISTCDKANTPIICSNLSNEASKKCIIETVAEYCLSEHVNISQAITEVEKTFSLNNID